MKNILSDNIKVSVIIPVYNTGKYVADAIKSIQNQSLSDIEIIAVDDCSTDNSLTIIKGLAKNDERILLIPMSENRGQSVCRNKGLEIATGDYIYFFDSDDLLEKNCLELCYDRMESGDSDFLIFDGDSFVEEGVAMTFNATYKRTQLLKKEIYEGKELIHYLIKNKSYSCSVCLSFIRKSYLDKINIKFYPGVLYEDILYSCELYLNAENVTFLPTTFFHRRVRGNSTMTSKIESRAIEYRFTVGNELLKLKKQFTDNVSRFVINNQAQNIFVFLTKSLIRSHQYSLLKKYSARMVQMIFKSV